jgi:hypothetical protein
VLAVVATASMLVVSCSGSSAPAGADAPTAGATTTTAETITTTTEGDLLLTVIEVADSYAGFRDARGPADRRSIEATEWLAYCAEAFGFSVTVHIRPGQPPLAFTDAATDDQISRWVEVEKACMAESYDRGWVAPYPTTREQLTAYYELLLEVNACLADLGYGTTAPSLEAFLEEGDWNVYANTPVGAVLVNTPFAGDDLPETYGRQMSIQAQCPLWP